MVPHLLFRLQPAGCSLRNPGPSISAQASRHKQRRKRREQGQWEEMAQTESTWPPLRSKAQRQSYCVLEGGRVKALLVLPCPAPAGQVSPVPPAGFRGAWREARRRLSRCQKPADPPSAALASSGLVFPEPSLCCVGAVL